MIEYNKGIHPHSGLNFEVHHDIVITPFFTPEFCKELVELAKFYRERFIWDPSSDLYPNWELFLTDVNRFMFDDFVEHYKTRICPMLNRVYLKDDVWGFFSPFINRYTMDSQRSQRLHNDTSMVSMVIKLNDDYEGAVLEFPRQGWNNKDLPPGYAVIFPGSVTHPHHVTELESGVKYTFVSWTWPDNWRDPKGKARNGPPEPAVDRPKLF